MKTIICVLIGLFLFTGCRASWENKNVDDKFNKICFEGHTYYMRASGHKGYLAIKLNHDGRPVKCNVGEEK